jgi:AraC family transcriptional regulator of adaptative response/methylated-DNA-[protein]-cysteine methyltransferase
MTDYQIIEKAIHFIRDNFLDQPELEKIAKAVNLSPFHFQRLFKKWAGVSPKKFLQFISLEHAKKLLRRNGSLLDVSLETGLSGPSRLHDLFVIIEAMTPGEYKNGGENLTLSYRSGRTPFGPALAVSTGKGLCHLEFSASEKMAIRQVKQLFPRAQFCQKRDPWLDKAFGAFSREQKIGGPIKIHIKASPFQLKVWQALINIPMGHLWSYGEVARHIDHGRACRAVGTAVGQNPVAYLIPCHRVIQSTGIFGNYGGGKNKKVAMIGWEGARVFGEHEPD